MAIGIALFLNLSNSDKVSNLKLLDVFCSVVFFDCVEQPAKRIQHAMLNAQSIRRKYAMKEMLEGKIS